MLTKSSKALRFSELKWKIMKSFENVYIPIKNVFFPWNVVKLKKLDRSWQETDVRMEEAIMTLLDEFFDGQQPFHNCDYEKKPTLERHRELLEEAKEDLGEKYEIFKRLLDILEWYRNGGLKVTYDGVFLACLMQGWTVEKAKQVAELHEREVNERFCFVIENRKYLWT